MKYLILAIILIFCLIFFHKRKKIIYLDNNGTTYPYKSVVKTISDKSFLGNPSGIYATEAKNILEDFKKKILKLMGGGKNHKVIITSGGSESNNLLLRGFADKYPGSHFILSEVEHKTSLECCNALKKAGKITFSLAKVDPHGRVILEDLLNLINAETRLISVMHINNETGTINDIQTIAKECNKNNIYFHSDIAQSFGKIPPNIDNINAVSISMHKLHGGLGIGALVINIDIEPQISGIQNNGMRGGTENIPAIAGASKCLDLHFINRDSKNSEMIKKIEYLKSYLNSFSLPPLQHPEICEDCNKNNVLQNYRTDKLFHMITDKSINTLLFSAIGYCNVKLRKSLWDSGIIVSIGSTCNTNIKGASHVLKAINVPYCIRCGVLRVSISDQTSYSDLKKFSDILIDLLKNVNEYKK